jgi:hypothetical protein
MAYQHGVYTSEVETALSTAPSVDASLPFVVGASRASFGPKIVSSWRQFVELSGLIEDTDLTPDDTGWFNHSLVSFAYFWFRIAGRGECIMQGLASAGLTNGKSDLLVNDILGALDSLDTIYEQTRREPSILCVPYFAKTAAIQAAMYGKMAQYGGRFKGIALCDLPVSRCALSDQSITLVDDPDDALVAKTSSSPYLCVSWPYGGVDSFRFDFSTILAAVMNRVDGQNGSLPFVSPSNKNAYVTGLYVQTSAEQETIEGCTVVGDGDAWVVRSNGSPVAYKPGCEYSSPENPDTEFLRTSGNLLCVADESDIDVSPFTLVVEYTTGMHVEEHPVFLNRDDVNTKLDGNGIVSALNTASGWVIWGNNTTAYPGSLDVKDYLIPIRRMFNYVQNFFQVFASARIDNPLNRRQLEGVVNSFNQVLASLQGFGALNSAAIELDDERNTTEQLIAGVVYFRIRIAPPPPMKEIHGVFEYDVEGFEASIA